MTAFRPSGHSARARAEASAASAAAAAAAGAPPPCLAFLLLPGVLLPLAGVATCGGEHQVPNALLLSSCSSTRKQGIPLANRKQVRVPATRGKQGMPALTAQPSHSKRMQAARHQALQRGRTWLTPPAASCCARSCACSASRAALRAALRCALRCSSRGAQKATVLPEPGGGGRRAARVSGRARCHGPHLTSVCTRCSRPATHAG